jgi:tetratricopeptide (TPR) repeat protein
VDYCVKGMAAEAAGRMDEALSLFMQAWAAAKDDLDRCIAAHYIARQQEKPEDALHWNRAALEYASASGSEQALEFYPSLYLNLGWSYETIGDRPEAVRYYRLGAASLSDLPAGPYRDMVERGLTEGLKRICVER